MRIPKSERGVALVIAILVMLVLSALGMVALQASLDGTWMAGTHRVYNQADSFSESVVNVGLYRTGTRADGTYSLLRSQAEGELDGLSDGQARAAVLRRGGYRIFSPLEDPRDGKVSLYEMMGGARLLEGGGEGVESIPNMGVEFRYIVRDPMTGPSPPGFDENYCLVRMTIASEVLIGRNDGEEGQRRRLRGVGRNAADAFVGPVPCGGG